MLPSIGLDAARCLTASARVNLLWLCVLGVLLDVGVAGFRSVVFGGAVASGLIIVLGAGVGACPVVWCGGGVAWININ